MTTYGMDVHGTLACWGDNRTLHHSNYFPFLSQLMKAWVENGDTVYIVSGPPIDTIEQEMAQLGLEGGVHYHGILSMVAYLEEEGHDMWQDKNGRWWCDPGLWNDLKGGIATKHGIDIIVDNQKEYGPAMPDRTQFILIENAQILKP